MAGLDLPVKLRQGLGEGRVLSEEELIEKLQPYDEDKKGSLNIQEAESFLRAHRIGGPWFAGLFAKSLWRIVEERQGAEVKELTLEVLARILHFTMSQPPRPEKRFQISLSRVVTGAQSSSDESPGNSKPPVK